MTNNILDWEAALSFPASKAAVQHLPANAGADRLEIDAAPSGEADLTVNGKPIAHVAAAARAGHAAATLSRSQKEAAEKRFESDALEDDEVNKNLKRLRARTP